jgi:hypothetical protein
MTGKPMPAGAPSARAKRQSVEFAQRIPSGRP